VARRQPLPACIGPAGVGPAGVGPAGVGPACVGPAAGFLPERPGDAVEDVVFAGNDRARAAFRHDRTEDQRAGGDDVGATGVHDRNR